MACIQAYASVLEYVRCNVAPAVCSGAALLATLRSTRLLPTGCERHGILKYTCICGQECVFSLPYLPAKYGWTINYQDEQMVPDILQPGQRPAEGRAA